MFRIKKSFFAFSKGVIRNPIPFLLLISLLSGLFIGTLYINSDHTSPELKKLLDTFILSDIKSTFTASFLRTFCSVLPFYISAICLSFCSLGMLIQIFIPFIFSLGYGVLFGYAFKIYTVNGFLYLLSTLSLPFTLTAILIIFSVKEASRISNLQFRFIKGSVADISTINMREEIKLTVFRQFFFLIFLTVSSLLKSVLLISFRNMIKL